MKLTEQYIDQRIDQRIDTVSYQRVPGTTTTVCTTKLVNGFVLLGQSACIHANNFDEQVGKDIAYKKARDKIWELEGYLACEVEYQSDSANHDSCTRWLFKTLPETPSFDNQIEFCSISQELQQLFRTKLNLFTTEQQAVLSECWNTLEGKADRAGELTVEQQAQIASIYAQLYPEGGKS